MKIKKIIAGMLAIAFVVCTSGVTAKAAAKKSKETATLDGVSVEGYSDASSTSAYCTTYMSRAGSASVTGTYSYVNFKTLGTGSKTAGNGGQYGGKVLFYAPTDCRSVKVTGKHIVRYGAHYWEAETIDIY